MRFSFSFFPMSAQVAVLCLAVIKASPALTGRYTLGAACPTRSYGSYGDSSPIHFCIFISCLAGCDKTSGSAIWIKSPQSNVAEWTKLISHLSRTKFGTASG
jgi:hypothetical protein